MTATAITPTAMTEAPGRIPAIDVLRGLAIVLMMLDHSRDFIHGDAVRFNPMDMSQTTPLVFLTRWVTHYCAPTFVFLAGLSAGIQSIRGLPRSALARWLVGRGMFLIALELLVVRPLIWFNLDFGFLAHLQVIWAIGCSMIVLAGLIWCPIWLVGATGIAIVAGHNYWDWVQVPLPARTWTDAFWVVLHQGGTIAVTWPQPATILAHYPLVPWIGIMALGYSASCVYRQAPKLRRRWLALAGIALVATFVVLRMFAGYGDPYPWVVPTADESPQLNEWQRAVFSFLNTEKYPPSLQFACMTLGPALLFLAFAENHRPAWLARRLIVFGSVPLLFYLLQWPTVHLLSMSFQWLAELPLGWGADNPVGSNRRLSAGPDFGLGAVYLGWGIGLALLYPICAWYGDFKRRHRNWPWLSFF